MQDPGMRVRGLGPGVSVLLVAWTGCGSSLPVDPTVIPLDSWGREVAAVQCAEIFGCCDATERMQWGYADETQCRQMIAAKQQMDVSQLVSIDEGPRGSLPIAERGWVRAGVVAPMPRPRRRPWRPGEVVLSGKGLPQRRGRHREQRFAVRNLDRDGRLSRSCEASEAACTVPVVPPLGS